MSIAWMDGRHLASAQAIRRNAVTLAWMAVGAKPAGDLDLDWVLDARPGPGGWWHTEAVDGLCSAVPVRPRTVAHAREVREALVEAGWVIETVPSGRTWAGMEIVAVDQVAADTLLGALRARMNTEAGDRAIGLALGYPAAAVDMYARRDRARKIALGVVPPELVPYAYFRLSDDPGDLALVADARQRILAAFGCEIPPWTTPPAVLRRTAAARRRTARQAKRSATKNPTKSAP
jgi:hypothetical protein